MPNLNHLHERILVKGHENCDQSLVLSTDSWIMKAMYLSGTQKKLYQFEELVHAK